MNHLYRAVEILGRSVAEIDKTGWVCSSWGNKESAKCVNSVLSVSAGGYAEHIVNLIRVRPEQEKALRMAAIALLDAAPDEIMDDLLRQVVVVHQDNPGYVRYWESRGRDAPDILALGDMLISVNDHQSSIGKDVLGNPVWWPSLDEKSARAWFDRAFDLLAAELPEPIPANPLTVDQIVGAPKLAETRSEMLGIPDDVIV